MNKTRAFLALPLFCAAAALLAPVAGLAQSTPFLSDDEIRMLINEISGDRSFEHIRWLTHWHRLSGSEGYFNAVEYILKAAREAGLEDVRFIEQPLQRPSYNVVSGELWMVEPVEVKLADVGDHALYLSDGSRDADLTAELVWVGDASPESLKDIDVAGKIVLTTASPSTAVRTAVWGKGAVGVVSYPIGGGKSAFDYPDQLQWTRIPSNPPEGKEGTFAFSLPARKGDTLRRILATSASQDYFASGKRTEGGRVVLRAKVDTEISETPGRTGFVEGWIRGTKYHGQQIVLTSHIQEEQGSANDNASGCGNLLDLARALNKLIKEGKMERPLRDIRFWWADEIYSEYRYFRDFPDEAGKMLANINQDMVGARQTLGSRIQHLIYAPYSRTSYLDTLLESVGTFVIRTNNAYLAAGRAGGLPRPHSRAIYSTRGSRDGYNAALVPYFDSSDHRCFVEGIIGVPAIGLINWGDDFIHSSDDDLFQIDQTQLKRNSFIVGALTFILAFADTEEVTLLAGETYASGSMRLANDLAVAMRLLREDAGGGGWKDAVMVIEQGIRREVGALESVRIFTAGNAGANGTIDAFIAGLREKERDMAEDLETCYRSLHGADPGPVELSPEEVAAGEKVPANVASVDDYFAKRGQVRYRSNLHSLMRDEVYNFVDGERSYYDIYKAVRAEALAVGSWYYGTVSLADVAGLLDAAVAAGALELK